VPRVGIVASGLIRVFRLVPDGRTITNRYVGRGGVAGIPTLFASPIAAQVHALTASTIYQFPASAWQQAARKDARIACAFLEIVSELLMTSTRQSTTDVLGSVRQRVVRQLLDIAAERQHGPELVAPVTQQQLADGIGSAREVVARVLRGLREERLVTTGVGGVVLLDPLKLQSELTSVV
jgi:CRP/FNR family transcriptional regulator